MTDAAGTAGDDAHADGTAESGDSADPDAAADPGASANPDESVATEESADADGIDFAWVMQTTFVVTILVGAPLVTLLSVPVALPDWNARAEFAIRVGAVVWFCTAIGVAAYEKQYR